MATAASHTYLHSLSCHFGNLVVLVGESRMEELRLESGPRTRPGLATPSQTPNSLLCFAELEWAASHVDKTTAIHSPSGDVCGRSLSVLLAHSVRPQAPHGRPPSRIRQLAAGHVHRRAES
ncbi:hypothetical protein C8Q74DRAFT_347434 [Fomes fomentarius]|nr:hypothetical protein C8Q74DRAFT_347434 [Fomes fomentarius]